MHIGVLILNLQERGIWWLHWRLYYSLLLWAVPAKRRSLRKKVRIGIIIADIAIELDLLILLKKLIRLDMSLCCDTPSRCGVLIAHASAVVVSVWMVISTVTIVVIVIAIFECIWTEYFAIRSARIWVRSHLF